MRLFHLHQSLLPAAALVVLLSPLQAQISQPFNGDQAIVLTPVAPTAPLASTVGSAVSALGSSVTTAASQVGGPVPDAASTTGADSNVISTVDQAVSASTL